MKNGDKANRIRYNSPAAVIPIITGILLNYLGSKLASTFDFPIYLDNVGTILSAALGGPLPGIITAIVNNSINYVFDKTSIYYASISALIAVTSFYSYRRGLFKSFRGIVSFIFTLAFIGGFLGGIVSWFLYGAAEDGIAYVWMKWVQDHLVSDAFWSHIIPTFAFDLIDKTITALIAILIIRIIPQNWKDSFWLSGWKQTPDVEQAVRIENDMVLSSHSLNTRISLMLVFASLSMAIVVTGVSSTLFTDYSKEQHFEMANGVAKLAAAVVDPDRVDEFIEKGDSAEGYMEAEKMLYEVRESSPDIEYLYVYKIEEDGCHVVFDLDTENVEGGEPGDLVPFDESFSDRVPALLAGEPIDPIETNDTFGWLLTVYEPVYNDAGDCVCYACADVQVSDINAYRKDFVVKVILLFLGFFILILVIGLWLAKYHVILPINSMAQCANDFAFGSGSDNESVAEKSLERIKALDIKTGDEVQELYESFCKMTSDTLDHMKDIQKKSDSINELQRGLIMTMADMVEGRDSDTGNHVRKTAAYARIIMDSLKEMGYYTDILTDSYIEDVERSAPLHDVGKIAVSDVILNKPGKLTDDEYGIMQTHTTAGRDMLDQVIETVHGESYLQEARNLAAYHHEKWNGKGYPDGLAGEEIPLSARIMAIADVFDALSSKRVYKDAMPFEKAVSIIKEDSGTHFDPKCVEAFLAAIDKVKEVLDYYNELESEGSRVRGKEKEVKKDVM